MASPNRSVSLWRRAATLGAAVALAVSAVSIGAVTPVAAAHGNKVTPAVGGFPKVSRAVQTAAAHFSCQDVPLDTGDGRCYTPQQIRAAYGIQSLLDRGTTGKGRTIVIIDSYSNPYIRSDLRIFDETFGLPDPVFRQVAPDGLTPFDFNNPEHIGWSSEISLDVQWAHAVAPGAAITLVLAKSSLDTDILSATKYAVDHNLGDVISQSFGVAESCVDPALNRAQHRLFQEATDKGISLFASTGDDGAAQYNCDGTDFVKQASSPANDPLVTAVGATNLQADSNTGAYGSERAWADQFSGADFYTSCFPTDQFGCSGGGFSNTFDRPAFQDSVRRVVGNRRGLPDVAYNGGVDGGVLAHWGVGLQALFGVDPKDPHFFAFGGTSAGVPQWAGLTVLADQLAHHRLGSINDDLYRIASSPARYRAAFHDVTTGNNAFTWCATVATDGSACTATASLSGYQTRRGWDAVTGLGTPKADVLVPMLAAGSPGGH